MNSIYSKLLQHNENSALRAVPSFLQNKLAASNEKVQQRVKKIANQSKQYQLHASTDETERAALRKRISLNIKNIPKIIRVSENNQTLNVLIQCPKKLLVDSLKLYRKLAQIEKVMEVVKTLFDLVELYGYFYCDNLMLKMSEDGLPVVWINSNFKTSYCQFPIRNSSVSQLIFIKKLISTFSELIIFSKNFQAQTKTQLFNYLQQERNKIRVLFEQFPSVPIKKSNPSNGPVLHKQRSTMTLPFNHCPSNKDSSVRLFKQFTPSKVKKDQLKVNKLNMTLSNNSVEGDGYGNRRHARDEDPDKDRKSEYKKRQRHTHGLSVNRRKTTTFQKYSSMVNSKLINKRQKSQKNPKSISNFVLDDTHLKPQNAKISSIQQMKRSDRKSYNPNDQQNETISQQFNFETEAICDNDRRKLLNKKASKQRKKSVDVNLIASWMKNDKPNDQPFPHSTFSTRVTFSSLKGQLEKTIDNQSSKSKINNDKSENYHIPHIYSAQKQKQAKQKLNADIKKIMKESGMKIKQQDSFENQVQNLLESDDPLHIPFSNKGRKISVKESLLMEELQQLFESKKSVVNNNEGELSFTKDFESVLELE